MPLPAHGSGGARQRLQDTRGDEADEMGAGTIGRWGFRRESNTPSSPAPAIPKEGAMDYSNKAHRMTDEELEEWNRDPISFIRAVVIVAGLSLLFWAAVVALWVIF